MVTEILPATIAGLLLADPRDFVAEVKWRWARQSQPFRTMRRRPVSCSLPTRDPSSEKCLRRMNWDRMNELLKRYPLPPVTITRSWQTP